MRLRQLFLALAQIFEKRLPINWQHTTALDVVTSAVQGVAEISGLVRRCLFRLLGVVHFHSPKVEARRGCVKRRLGPEHLGRLVRGVEMGTGEVAATVALRKLFANP